MLQRLFGRRSGFLKKMNTLMELYATTHNTEATYRELLHLEKYVSTEGEYALFLLNKASLLYDMKEYRKAADIVMDIQPLNPQFDAKVANLKTLIMSTNVR